MTATTHPAASCAHESMQGGVPCGEPCGDLAPGPCAECRVWCEELDRGLCDSCRASYNARAAYERGHDRKDDERYLDPMTDRADAPCAICGTNVSATVWHLERYGANGIRCWIHFGEPIDAAIAATGIPPVSDEQIRDILDTLPLLTRIPASPRYVIEAKPAPNPKPRYWLPLYQIIDSYASGRFVVEEWRTRGMAERRAAWRNDPASPHWGGVEPGLTNGEVWAGAS